MLSDLPEDVQNAVVLVKHLLSKPVLSLSEKEKMKLAKIKIAFWVCRQEKIRPTRDNLSFVLGNDSKDIMMSYDKYLSGEASTVSSKGKGKGKNTGAGDFWADKK